VKTKPYKHQAECLRISAEKKEFAILMEQGLGKSKVAIDTAEILFKKKRISGMLVVAPNGVHTNWAIDEITTHLDARYVVNEYSASRKDTKKSKTSIDRLFRFDGLKVLCMNVESLSTSGYAFDLSKRFLEKFPSLMVVDESSRIKTPSASRTKRVITLGRRAEYRRICTGTPVTQSPFDLYSQFAFLDPMILGFFSFYAFKHHYGIWEKKIMQKADKKWDYENLVKYVNLDHLSNKIRDHSYRRTKKECLDLPDKIRKKIYVEMTAVQKNLLKEMTDEGLLRFSGFEELTPLQITRLLRCQQIVGGFLPSYSGPGERDEGKVVELPENPKMNVLAELIADHPGKMVIWARFKPEIHRIVDMLKMTFGHETVVEIHGDVKDKHANADAFQKKRNVRFVVGQQQSGIGLNLFEAETVVYYSNPFSYEQRYQSEDRCHRIGLKHPVLYIDLVARDTVDERVIDVLLKAEKIADAILDDHRRTNDRKRKEKSHV